MADTAKAVILRRLVDEGHSEGYGALVHLTALMEINPDEMMPETVQERHEWSGHFKGLRSALACVAMQERKLRPRKAAEVVGGHIAEAIKDLIRFEESG